MAVVYVKCGLCKGTGRLELSSVYRNTLNLLSVHNPCTGAKLAKCAGCKPTAMNNRLAILEKHKLVTSKRDGRQRIYRLAAGVFDRVH